MRGTLAAKPADRFARTVTSIAWGLGALFFLFAALPFASSSPYPTPSGHDWTPYQSATRQSDSAQMELASAPSYSLASASSTPASPSYALASSASQTVALVNTVRTVSFRRPDAEAGVAEVAPIVTASLGNVALPADDVNPIEAPSRPKRPGGSVRRGGTDMNEVDQYLWEVYRRSPVKKDRSGDFTWKDPAAATKAGMTLQAYVIQGMDADLREQLYHAGKAMDAAGIEWTIVSAFRDDYRQSIAAGLKARTGYSRHGGSKATGGYGHGRAVDIGHADGRSHMQVFRWIDENGTRYGLSRPIRHFDPPHVEPRPEWRRIASALRRERTGSTAVAEAPAEETRATNARSRVARYTRSGRRYN
jgi:hypothetical protein